MTPRYFLRRNAKHPDHRPATIAATTGVRGQFCVAIIEQSKADRISFPLSKGGEMVGRKRPRIAAWIIPLLIGLIGYYRVTQSPKFEMYRAVDVVQLVGSGVCFGAVIVGVIFMLRGRQI